MTQRPLRRLTIRAAMILGFGLTMSLWLFTGSQIARRSGELERRSGDPATRYVQAQDLLAVTRVHILATSGAVRDALFDSGGPTRDHLQQAESRLTELRTAVGAYVLVLDSADERAALQHLQGETGRFESAMRALLTNPDRSADPRATLRTVVLPRREEMLRRSEELQALNRAAFVQHQQELHLIEASAEQWTWRQLGLALALSLGVAVLATLYASRLETRLKTELDKDARNTAALQQLSTRLIHVQEEERRRLARELHDEVGQALTAIKVELAVAQRRIDASTLLEPAQQITDQTLQTVRNMSRLLHPAALDDLGLQAAVDSYLSDFSRRTGIRAELLPPPILSRLPSDIERAAFRIVQEALTNIARHADATSCTVTMQRRLQMLEVIVEDNGRGFDTGELERSPRPGLGLLGVSERVAHLNGSMSIDSRQGHGTRLFIALPASTGPSESEEPTTADDGAGIREAARG
jgi:signal transduction histidine kinase